MTSFAELEWVDRVSSPAPQTKPAQYTFNIHSIQELEEFAKKWGLNEDEKVLLRLTELQGYTRSQIAHTLGVTRQNVSQKLCNLHRRIGKKQQKSQ